MQKGGAANPDNNYLVIFMALHPLKLLAFSSFWKKKQEQKVFQPYECGSFAIGLIEYHNH